jgi:hypothetical protein
MGTSGDRRKVRGRARVGRRKARTRTSVGVLAAALLAVPALGAVPAGATVTGTVGPGRNITVFHNIDMVGAFGWQVGEELTISVVRNGVTIGTARGPVVITPEGPGLEVNHEATTVPPAPGSCWESFTPDILPGDVVTATNGTETDEVTVDDLRFTGDPYLNEATGDVLVDGVAKRFDGSPIPVAQLDSPEFRDGSRLRAVAGEIEMTGTPGVAGGFTMRYPAPFNFDRNRDNLTEPQLRDRLLHGEGHMIGFGHTDPLPADTQMREGLHELPGPGLGCQGSPGATYGVSQVSPAVLNIANRGTGLTVSGLSLDASAVTAVLTDSSGSSTTRPAAVTGTTGSQTWTARFTPAQLRPLQGRIVVSGRYTHSAGGVLTGTTKSVVRDLQAPKRPTASLQGREYLGRQVVRINSPSAEDAVRYTLGNGAQPRPSATSGNRYNGQPLVITASQTLKMVAVDQAGNSSPLVSERYTIKHRVVPGRPRLTGLDRGPSRATVRWSPPRNDGPGVTAYRVRAYRGSSLVKTAHARGRATRLTVRGLANGRTYRFSVQARNAIGWGPQSARSRPIVARSGPARPRIGKASSGAAGGRVTAVARWTRAANTNGTRVNRYQVTALRLGPNGSTAPRRTVKTTRARARSLQMTLDRGRYRFRVRAVNTVGASRPSARSNVVRAR